MVLNSFAFSFAIMFTLLKKKIYGNTKNTAPALLALLASPGFNSFEVGTSLQHSQQFYFM